MDTQRLETKAEREAREHREEQDTTYRFNLGVKQSMVSDRIKDVERQLPPFIEWRDFLNTCREADRTALNLIVSKFDGLGAAHYSVRAALTTERNMLRDSIAAYDFGPFDDIMDLEARAAAAGITKLPNRSTIVAGRFHLDRTNKMIAALEAELKELAALKAQLDAEAAALPEPV